MKRIFLSSTHLLILALVFLASQSALACSTPEAEKAASQPFLATTSKTTDELYKQIMAQMHRKMDKVKSFGISKDKQFLELMIPHHEAAIQMAQVILLHTQDEKIKNLALSIITDQRNEIEFMNLSLKGEPK